VIGKAPARFDTLLMSPATCREAVIDCTALLVVAEPQPGLRSVLAAVPNGLWDRDGDRLGSGGVEMWRMAVG
jgi:hypothetical protein